MKRPKLCAVACSIVAMGLVLPLAGAGAQRAGWVERVSVSVSAGPIQPTASSEIHALVDGALSGGSRAFRPTLLGAAMHLAIAHDVSLRLGVEHGNRRATSTSMVQSSGEVARQETSFEMPSTGYVGAEWRALHWRGKTTGSPDRLRLALGAGVGTARYRLYQRGEFVDTSRDLMFQGELLSQGRGNVRYASAGVDVPVWRGIALTAELRRQAGSAPMNADYAAFDPLDLGGTRFSIGMLVRPTRLLRR